ncbi:hypothetical protein [Flavobacterium sp.]|uniref:hypothetical protein n=1 Tax=Flavobacterium sp. TaxID=239 RepID=UPI00286E3C5E|nr:hypothetical protein [Flavobacterium sp.]
MKNTILLLLIVLTSCSKNNDASPIQDQLPPITTTGANTAGCYINGKLLVPKNGIQSIGGSPTYGLIKIQGNNFWPDKNDYWQLEIANKKDINGSGIILWIKNMQNGNGDYIVGQSNGELYADGPNNNQIIAGVTINGVNKTYFSSPNSGIIKILRSDLSVGTSIYSGTFNCSLYNKDNPSEVIEITEGRFDFNSLTLNK